MAITETKGQGKGRSDRGKIPPHIPSLDQELRIVNFFIEQGIFSEAEINDIAELSRRIGPDNYLEITRSPETDTPVLALHQNGAHPSAADIPTPLATRPKTPKRPEVDSPRLNNSRLNMGTVLELDEETEIASRQEAAPDVFSEALPLIPTVDIEEAQATGGWEKHLTAVELAQRELEAGIETGISPAKGRVEIDGANVMLLQGDVATLQLMRLGLTKKEIAIRRYPGLPLAEAERQVDFSFARIADEFRWVKFSLVPQRREDGETIFELSHKNPQQQAKKEDSAPTLADRLGLRISSKIVTNSSRDLTQFDVEQGATEYSVILDKWESVIFNAYFSFTHIPTVAELTESLPKSERRNFFTHLYNLNRKIEERLLISLSQQKKEGGGWDERVIVPKRVEPKPKPTPAPAAALEPEPAPPLIQPKPPIRRLFRNEIEEERMSTKEVVSHVTRADKVDPRRYEDDNRIPMRLIESLMPSEAKVLIALAGTSVKNTLPASGWATGLTAMQLMEQINPSIHSERLRICRTPNGGYYLDDFISDLRPKLPEVKTG